MVKKRNENTEPKISNIPIPASENPMVIDLPDGQKIVLGKLTPGAVIEVATWRGTGRPDSRTNRFMLGISDSNEPQTSPPTPNQESNKVKKRINLPWKRENMQSVEQSSESRNVISRFIGGIITAFSKALKRTQDLTPVETTTDLEINAWLENLSRGVKEAVKPPKPRKAPAKKTATAKKTTAAPKKKRN